VIAEFVHSVWLAVPELSVMVEFWFTVSVAGADMTCEQPEEEPLNTTS
jgi:hypothetical protein